MNLQSELQRIAVKYGVNSQVNFKREVTNVVAMAVADLVEISNEKSEMDSIIKVVAQEFSMPFKAMFAPTRKHSLLLPRQMAQYFLCEHNYKLTSIAHRFGYADHTTVINSRDKIKNYIKQGYFINEFMAIKEKLSSPLFVDQGEAATDCEF